jgi:FkbM family methyltransferase
VERRLLRSPPSARLAHPGPAGYSPIMSRVEELLKILRARLQQRAEHGAAPRVYRNDTRNDQWIVEHVFPGKRNGYFVEAGASNGREASSCYVLEEEFGWTGICVEPNEVFFEQLVRNRPASICANVCLAGHAGKVSYVEGTAATVNPYLGGITANLERIKHGGGEVVRKGKRVERQAMTLEELLVRHAAPSTIDYAAFDIEGSEFEVLEGFPFERYIFLALSLECDGSIWEPVSRLLGSNGYREVSNPFNQGQPWERYWLHRSNLVS